MCRLMYLPSKVRPPKKILRHWFEKLEDSNGGHGNGYATHRGGCVKGLRLTADQCTEAIHTSQAPVVWHTRYVSCGRMIDDLCHPFPTANGNYLVHNGHWPKAAFAAKLLKGEWSDTAVAALHIRLHGWDSFVAECNSGVWLHLTKKGCQVHYASGSLMVDVNTGALASEACPGWGDWVNVAYGTYGACQRPKQVQFSNWRSDAEVLADEIWEPISVGKHAAPAVESPRRAVEVGEKSDRGVPQLKF